MAGYGGGGGRKQEKDDVGSYLEQFLSDVRTLPAELQRKFTLIHDLDQKSHNSMGELENLHQQVVNSKPKGEAIKEVLEKMRRLQEEAVHAGEEKVSLAMQAYDEVDNRIRQLDTDLKRFEDELKQDPNFKDKLENAEKKQDRKRKRDQKSGGAAGSGAGADSADMAVDPHEPVYCICRQVSFGEMVACDNPDCTIEWFHFQCVGLTETPNKTWYCPDCRSKRRSGMFR